MSVCPKCGASLVMYDFGGNPWYACGSHKTFRSAPCVDREPVATQLREAQDRIKRLEDIINRAHLAFFSDSSDRKVSIAMHRILDEEVRKETKP